MITISEAKKLARELARSEHLTHSQVLEAAAHAAGHRDWNTFAAMATRGADDVARQRVVPILRIFDHALAREFYCGFLGFRWVWEHRFEPDLPLYAEVEREGCVVHLSEHHGDATPGSGVMIVVDDLDAYHAALIDARHGSARPGVEENGWGRTMTVTDPFGNRLVFWQRG